MERLDEITLYRFRVRTADGREAVSRVVATRRPVRARLGTEDEITSLAAEEEHPPMLANPRWSSDSFAHGDRASLQVDAAGLDGRTVRFIVEQRDGEDWSELETVEGKVEGGVAEVALQIAHPHASDAGAEPADLRFSCELV
jgi:hypothetical protein